ncbi:hypothetical protein M0R45_026798 [Rubus argutus]|uniref:CRAL-TRIO domain-containing protein n=1 Tax=Rubus argutus TaxID=59490 RepID=A0AAW1X098_RUBAR
MAEEHEKPAADAVVVAVEPPCEEVVVESDAPPAEKSVTEKAAVPEPEAKGDKERATSWLSSLSRRRRLWRSSSSSSKSTQQHEFTSPPPPPVKEEEKPAVEEVKKEEEKPAEPEAPAPAPVCEQEPPKTEEAAEPCKVEESKAEEVKEAAKEEETVVVTEVVETVTTVEDDGAKTLEAIEETIVAVVPTPAAAEEASIPAKEAEAAVRQLRRRSRTEAEETPAAPPPPPEESTSLGSRSSGRTERRRLLKFLRARDYKVKDAFTMIKNTVRWRKEFGIDALLEEDLGCEWDKVVFSHGVDKEGHPVCYNVFGAFQNKELYQNTFTDEENAPSSSSGGFNSSRRVNDIKNSPGLFKREFNQVTNQALQLLQDNYPEFVAKQVFINVPWWYLAFNRMISPFLTQRTKSKFVFAGPSKSAETLFKYIAPEHVPVLYGGLSKEGECEFTQPTLSQRLLLNQLANTPLKFQFLRVGKIAPSDEPVISNSYKIGDAGKVVLTIDNQSSKKKKLLYRSKTKPSCD